MNHPALGLTGVCLGVLAGAITPAPAAEFPTKPVRASSLVLDSVLMRIMTRFFHNRGVAPNIRLETDLRTHSQGSWASAAQPSRLGVVDGATYRRDK